MGQTELRHNGVLRSSSIENLKLAHLRDACPSRREYAAIITRQTDRCVKAQDSYLPSF